MPYFSFISKFVPSALNVCSSFYWIFLTPGSFPTSFYGGIPVACQQRTADELLAKLRDWNSRLTTVRASFLRRGFIEGPDAFARILCRWWRKVSSYAQLLYSRDLDVDIFASHMAVFRLEVLSRQLGRHVTERVLPQVIHDLNERWPTDCRTVVNVCNKATIVSNTIYVLLLWFSVVVLSWRPQPKLFPHICSGLEAVCPHPLWLPSSDIYPPTVFPPPTTNSVLTVNMLRASVSVSASSPLLLKHSSHVFPTWEWFSLPV
jgi:hypothetical protein